MAKNPLKKLTIAITGDFGSMRTTEKMKQWIQINGGNFATEITTEVTHLICSKEHFMKGLTMVREARKIPGLRIVSFDWLEDSLMTKRARNERAYLMGPLASTAAETKARKKNTRKKNIAKGLEYFERGCKEFQKDMFSDGYGMYQDSTNFPYDITLARADLLTNKNERYALKLWISHATPKYFACNVKYSSPGLPPTHEILAPIGSSWETAWAAFKAFFKLKTKKDWAMRFMKVDLGADAAEAFVYTPPREGEPRGVFLELLGSHTDTTA